MKLECQVQKVRGVGVPGTNTQPLANSLSASDSIEVPKVRCVSQRGGGATDPEQSRIA